MYEIVTAEQIPEKLHVFSLKFNDYRPIGQWRDGRTSKWLAAFRETQNLGRGRTETVLLTQGALSAALTLCADAETPARLARNPIERAWLEEALPAKREIFRQAAADLETSVAQGAPVLRFRTGDLYEIERRSGMLPFPVPGE